MANDDAVRRQLAALFEGGEHAVALAAERGLVYEIEVAGDGPPLRARVRPVRHDYRNERAASVEVRVRFEGHPLLVTAVYNARRHARHIAPLGDVEGEYFDNVQRIIQARTVEGEVCVFASCPVDALAHATRRVLRTLLELRLASETALVVVHVPDSLFNSTVALGTPMYEGSDVLVGTLRRANASQIEREEEHRHSVQLLFAGGAWAVAQNQTRSGKQIIIARDPLVRLLFLTKRADRSSCLAVETLCAVPLRTWTSWKSTVSLLVVHKARLDAEAVLRESPRWRDLLLPLMHLTKQHTARNNEMAIFVLPDKDASEHYYAALLRMVLRKLYDLGLTAHEAGTDALVILTRDGALQADRILSLINEVSLGGLRRREIGVPVTTKAKPRRSTLAPK
jgi:hypothetical protein